jgi:hypothetical protein
MVVDKKNAYCLSLASEPLWHLCLCGFGRPDGYAYFAGFE